MNISSAALAIQQEMDERGAQLPMAPVAYANGVLNTRPRIEAHILDQNHGSIRMTPGDVTSLLNRSAEDVGVINSNTKKHYTEFANIWALYLRSVAPMDLKVTEYWFKDVVLKYAPGFPEWRVSPHIFL